MAYTFFLRYFYILKIENAALFGILSRKTEKSKRVSLPRRKKGH